MISWTEIAPEFSVKNQADLIAYIEGQRWFAGRGHVVASIDLVDALELTSHPSSWLLIVECHTGDGNAQNYQLFVERSEMKSSLDEQRSLITELEDHKALFDGTEGFELPRILMAKRGDGTNISGRAGEFSFRSLDDEHNIESVRALRADQSNTSLVIDESLLLKCYRRLEAGMNPELEMSLFLTEHGFSNLPRLFGWYGYNGSELRTTLGIVQQYLPDAVDGWTLGLRELDRPQQFLDRIGRLGEVVGSLHCALASDSDDPDFAPEESPKDAAALLNARIEGQIDTLAEAMPEGHADALHRLTRGLTELPLTGRLIRGHGDLHLGQVLWDNNDWFITDFEGEPMRAIADRRRKVHPLRDVAGIIRSFSYLVAVAEIEYRKHVPPRFEHALRELFLDGYRSRAVPAGLISSDIAIEERLLAVFGVEKVLYELDYESRHRPGLLSVPLVAIEKLLERKSA